MDTQISDVGSGHTNLRGHGQTQERVCKKPKNGKKFEPISLGEFFRFLGGRFLHTNDGFGPVARSYSYDT